jgi:hypothetical protein
MCPESRLVAFIVARQKDFIRTAKPITGCKAEGYKTNLQAYAYKLKEIGHMLEALGEPARTGSRSLRLPAWAKAKSVACAGPDYADGQSQVRRSVWPTHVGETKTDKSTGAVPVIGPLRTILDEHAKARGPGRRVHLCGR